MTHYFLVTIRYVLVAIAAAGALAGAIEAATASALLSVSATVVRSCKFDSTGSNGSVSLACSKDVTRVNVSGPTASEVLVLDSAATSVPASRTAADSSTSFVTLNF
jgi:hypothetical protein